MVEAAAGPPSSRDPAPDRLGTIPSLDGIRAIAALLVMVLHFFAQPGYSGLARKLSAVGQTGVDLFFVLSGFLITRILLESVGSPMYYRAFYARRCLRIFPLYYAFLAVFFFVIPVLRHAPVSPLQHQSWAWLYLQNVAMTFPGLTSSGPPHFWSLAVEEHFYLMWPLLVRRFSGRRFWGVLITALALPIAVRVVFLSKDIGTYYFTLTRMDAIGWGALIAYLHTVKRGDWQRHTPARVLLVAGAGLLLAVYAQANGGGADWLQVLKLSFIPCWFAVLLHFVLIDPLGLPLSHVLSTPLIRAIGKISYGLYVFHPLVFELVQAPFARNAWLDFVACFGLTGLTALASYRFFELRFLRLKQRFEYRLSSAGAAVVPLPEARLVAPERN